MEDIRNPELSARDRAACANALDKILDRKRILRMKPTPKPVDADKYEEQKRCARRAARPKTIRDARPTGHTQKQDPPSNPAEEYEMKARPGFPGVHVMVKKSPVNGVEAYPPEKPRPPDTLQTGETNNRHANPAQPSGGPLKKPPIYLSHFGVSINGS
jgi:hypothetical protein